MSSKKALAAIQTMKIIYGSQGRQNILPYHYLGYGWILCQTFLDKSRCFLVWSIVHHGASGTPTRKYSGGFRALCSSRLPHRFTYPSAVSICPTHHTLSSIINLTINSVTGSKKCVIRLIKNASKNTRKPMDSNRLSFFTSNPLPHSRSCSKFPSNTFFSLSLCHSVWCYVFLQLVFSYEIKRKEHRLIQLKGYFYHANGLSMTGKAFSRSGTLKQTNFVTETIYLTHSSMASRYNQQA